MRPFSDYSIKLLPAPDSDDSNEGDGGQNNSSDNSDTSDSSGKNYDANNNIKFC